MGWDYLLSLIRNEGIECYYTYLRDSFAKLDYDTLFIYNFTEDNCDLLADSKFIDYITQLVKREFGVSVLEILPLGENLLDLVAIDRE